MIRRWLRFLLKEEFKVLRMLADDMTAALAALQAQVTTLEANVATVEAQLAAAQANELTQSMVDGVSSAVTALTAVNAQLVPPAPPAS